MQELEHPPKIGFDKIPPKTLETDDNFALRLIEAKDAEGIFLVVDKNRKELSRWLDWVDQTQSPKDAEDFAKVCAQKRQDSLEAPYGIFVDGQYVGNITLIARDGNVGEIGYWLDKQYQGHGLATKASELLINLGFKVLGCQKIIIRAEEENQASRAVAERLNFQFTGIVFDKKRQFNAAIYEKEIATKLAF